jgi:putative ABC transport system ATP-binding protein
MLEFRDVVKHFRSGETVVRAVDGVSLTVAAGELVALYGPSGSGKTTMLLLAAGLDVPDSGSVLFDGRPLAAQTPREATRYRRSELGFIWQQFHLAPGMSALDNAAVKLVAEGMGRRAARRRAAPWLDRVGLGDRARHPPDRLSTGQRQRVAIARALANGPRLVLADEPTGSLDTALGRDVLAMLAEITHSEGVATVLVTHDPQAAAFADRVHTLRDGVLLDGAAPPAASQDEQTQSATDSVVT